MLCGLDRRGCCISRVLTRNPVTSKCDIMQLVLLFFFFGNATVADAQSRVQFRPAKSQPYRARPNAHFIHFCWSAFSRRGSMSWKYTFLHFDFSRVPRNTFRNVCCSRWRQKHLRPLIAMASDKEKSSSLNCFRLWLLRYFRFINLSCHWRWLFIAFTRQTLSSIWDRIEV